ncbi:MAG: branched-chain amino acid ABC transporter permease [Deltaproteobacteria bacterium]|nr:branched-chain amino acid ABC transporter permease [Deltaproteobacteria bacterium]MBW1909835.1 branched-chain amino acid ABC transporter permease [Deltaproteobacteria bacterium]MBW2033452.1 branched-chain amino acid ABC transporter permease [Deltaproteobacteria bacterium]MBW2114103.1 branched-chain amino acid ABC transporter permease [Deltaproteobacteria bacterium]MBW2357219.1 branched-chain amino acid ABC transporter permease [Deltaproteobacteria bacterium]
MNLTLLIQALIGGFLVGGVYSLIAIGLSLIFGVMKIINFAHGEIMMIAMYITYWLFVLLKIDPIISIIIVAPLIFLLGYCMQRFLVNRIIDAPELIQILLMLGVAIVLTNLALFIWGPDHRMAATRFSLSAIMLGGITIDVSRLIAFGIAIIVSIGVFLFLAKTETGKMIRAAADNRLGAQIVGIKVNRVYAISFGVGSACVGIAGALILPLIPLDPYLGPSYTLTSFIIVILGGMGSLLGAFIGGIIIGVAESLGAVLLVSSLKELVSFSILIVILLFRPQGLFGTRNE